MCGIWALFTAGHNDLISKSCASCMKIAHRGPDDFQIQSVPGISNSALGFHRLAIMGPLWGMQPMRIRAFPHLWLCNNGEIYNHKQLQDQYGFHYETGGDGECILHLYNHGGIDLAANQLDGVFAFTLVDTKNMKVFIARDTYGVRPLFRTYTADGLLGISSEAKGLTDLFDLTGKMKVHPLTPGHYESYDVDSLGKTTFTEKVCFHGVGQAPHYKTLISSCEDNISTNIRKLLSEAVRKRMMAQRRIGCMLSGGLDSSLVAALVVKHAKDMGLNYPIQSFSIGMESSPDLKAAREVARHIGTEHHELVMTVEDGLNALRKVIYHMEMYDVITIRGCVAMQILSEHISRTSDSVILMSGEGSDELCQGYIYFHKAPGAQEADAESRRLLRDLYLFDNLRADRTTAGAGLELRVPFLDHQFTSYYLSLPAETRQSEKGIEKALVRKAFDGTGLIPDHVLWRPKEGYSDGLASKEKSWFAHLQDYAETQVTSKDLENAPKRFPFNTPTTKEGYLYRRVFEEFFPGQAHLTPYYWMPKWIKTIDPSARVLEHYVGN